MFFIDIVVVSYRNIVQVCAYKDKRWSLIIINIAPNISHAKNAKIFNIKEKGEI